jgi:hypothetical protein
MRRVFLVFLGVAVLVIGLGFYLNWFSLASKDGDAHTNVSITVDKAKIKSDVDKAKEKIKDMAEGREDPER